MTRLTLALVALFALLSASSGPQEVRFTHVDVFLDPGTRGIEAWQLELVDPSGRAKVVGVEGGDDAVWSEAPYYDPAALQRGRIVIAAFTLEGGPTGRQRVARVHLAVQGPERVPFEVNVQAAADGEGAIQDVRAEVVQ